MTRRIRDGLSGRLGRASGSARFVAAAGALHYHEEGVLAFDGHIGDAARRYRLRLESPTGASVEFEDGRLFHRLDLASGIALVGHECPPDSYHGRYVVAGPHDWRLSWRVRGPRKHMVISTYFSRDGAQDSVSGRDS